MTVSADYLRDGMIRRGLPPHVADAFVLNMQDESGLNPGINEARPLVPGSRGGFGLYQLTGPRRRQYEAFASSRGVSPADVDAQLDFLMMELQGSEAAAARSILAARDTPTAAVAIVNEFLRPSPEHAQRRAARYSGGAMPSYSAPAAPQNAMPSPQAPQGGNPLARMAMPMNDPAAFMNAPNALAMLPFETQRTNSLTRYL